MCEKSIRVKEVKIESNKKCAKDTYILSLESGVLGEIFPGQFVCLQPLSENSAMARPFSIFDIESHVFPRILYKVTGENTRLMSLLKPGQKIKIWGPLGQEKPPFHYGNYDQVWFVGGGIGLAPLNYMASRFKHGGSLFSGKIFWGFKTNLEIPCVEWEFDPLSPNENYFVTEDGSSPHCGLVTDLLNEKLLENCFQEILVITCGPKPMMKQVAELCAACKTDCYVILETIMACGIGVCLGCSIKMKSGEMKRVCHDGPVFPAKEVIWDEI
jgi:dihydroorotate dehydrogenase electron transfer subunit